MKKRNNVDPLTLLHYGDLNGGIIKPSRITGVRIMCKPEGNGIIWGSPKGSAYGWPEWCMAEQSNWLMKPQWWISLSPKTRLLVIDSVDNLRALVDRYPPMEEMRRFSICGPHWPSVAVDYDAVWLTESGQWATRFSEPSMYGWDCETVSSIILSCARSCQHETAVPEARRPKRDVLR